jgi:serine/threonine-protein kinase
MPDTTPYQPNIPGFTIQGPAGQGGMGTVYVAEQRSPRRTVALKVLTRAADAGTLAQFRREAAVIAALEHPWIVPLYAYGEQSGQPYLVMRHLRGGSVADRIRSGPVEIGQAAQWVGAIAGALEFAHQRGLVHRDVKPSNILLDELGTAYLSDFGIAGTLADARAGLPTGSAAYMSPEQGRGEPVDARADIYALAVTLFELLTGEHPYTAETALGVIVRHIHDPIPSARARNPAIPAAVNELIGWTMEKDPAQRPQTAAQFGRLLDQAIADPSSQLRPAPAAGAAPTRPPMPAVPPRPARRVRVWMWGLAGLALVGGLAVGGAAVVGALLPSAPTPRPTATLPATLADEAAPVEPTNLLLVDDFSDPGGGFAVFSDADGGVEYSGGALQFRVLTAGVRWYSFSGRVEAADVEIGVTGQLLAGPPLSEIAVLCRWRGLNDFTALGVRADDSAAAWQVRGGETSMLGQWTAAPGLDFRLGEPYELTARCEGTSLNLEVNGFLVVQALDPQPVPGDVGLMAGLGEPGELLAAFDDLAVGP